MEEINTTEDLGFTEIEIAKVGEYNGSDKEGNPIKENLTEESLKAIVDEANSTGREILVDKQHNSMKKGPERDDSACGWLKALSFRNGSIFGKCFWTKLGRELIDSRILRFISPVFHLNGEGVPTKLVNVALVNQPALNDINPVINSQPTELKEESIISMNITKDELINLIKETVVNYCSEKKEEEVKNEVVEQPKAEETKEDTTEPVKEISDEPKQEVVSEEPKTEEPKKNKPVAIVVEETKVEENKEVIKEEALNSAPTIGSDVNVEPEWKKLRGKAFFKYLKDHPEIR